MARNVRSITARAVPWVALVLVAIFAFAQVRARREAERRSASAAAAAGGPASVGPSPAAEQAPAPLPSRAAARAERRLAQAQARFDAEQAKTRRRLEQVEALRSVAEARANALAEELEALEERTEQELSDKRDDDDIARWVADVESGDKQRVDAALKRAAKGTADDATAMSEYFAHELDHADALVRLIAAFPEACDLRGLPGVLVAWSHTEAGANRRLAMLPATRVSDEMSLSLWLSGHQEHVSRSVLAWAAARTQMPDTERDAWSAAAELALRGDPPRRWHHAAHAVGILRLYGHARRLAEVAELDKERAAALYALSRIPDLDYVRSQVQARMRRYLQEADDLETRTAALMLAERLLEEPLDWNPSAPKAQRDKALAPILKRFPE